MKLDDILGGSRVFVDANIFIYALQGRSMNCRKFLERCDGGSIEAMITTTVLAEISHRRMVQEAQQMGVNVNNPSRYLSQKPHLVRQLANYADEIRDLLDGGLTIEMVRSEDFLVALELQKQYGLLTNDSLNLAVARRLGIHEIATADAGFNPVQGIIVYEPGDLVL